MLDALPSPDDQGVDVATGALLAIQKLAAAKGVPLDVTIPKASSGSSGFVSSDRLKIGAGALMLLAIGIGIWMFLRIRRSRGAEATEPTEP